MYVAIVESYDIADTWTRYGVVAVSENIEALKALCEEDFGDYLTWEDRWAKGTLHIKPSGQTIQYTYRIGSVDVV